VLVVDEMKRLSAMERVGLCMGVVFIAFGVTSIVWPGEWDTVHSTSGWPPVSVIGPDGRPEHVTKGRARVYGVMSVGLGVGLAWMAAYRPRKSG
jgi:hypothetical protein